MNEHIFMSLTIGMAGFGLVGLSMGFLSKQEILHMLPVSVLLYTAAMVFGICFGSIFGDK